MMDGMSHGIQLKDFKKYKMPIGWREKTCENFKNWLKPGGIFKIGRGFFHISLIYVYLTYVKMHFISI